VRGTAATVVALACYEGRGVATKTGAWFRRGASTACYCLSVRAFFACKHLQPQWPTHQQEALSHNWAGAWQVEQVI
jgi:hypothetical protein